MSDGNAADFSSSTLATAPITGEPGTNSHRTATGQFKQKRRITYESLFGNGAQDTAGRHRAEGRSCDPVLGRLLGDLWRAVLPEGALPHRLVEETAHVEAELNALGPLDTPDLATSRRLIFLATKHAQDTIAKITSDCRMFQQQLTGLQLKQSVAEDENAHTRDEVTKAIKRRGGNPEETNGYPSWSSNWSTTLLPAMAQARTTMTAI